MKTGETWSCGMIVEPARYAPVMAALHGEDRLRLAARRITGSGIGCDAKLAGEPGNPAFKAKIRALAAQVDYWVEIKFWAPV